MLFPQLLASGGTEELAKSLSAMLNGLPPHLIIFIISMIPVLELRGGLIAAAVLDVPMWQAVIACILGNILPSPFILLFFEKVLSWMEQCKVGFLRKFALWLKARATGPKAQSIRRYEFVGLMLFVGIPLPGTGAWTGSMIAALLHISRKKSVPAIFLGLIMATIIMCIVSYGGLAAIARLFK